MTRTRQIREDRWTNSLTSMRQMIQECIFIRGFFAFNVNQSHKRSVDKRSVQLSQQNLRYDYKPEIFPIQMES